MPTPFFKIPYNYEKIKLTKIFENEKTKSFTNKGLETEESVSVYGNLNFPEFDPDKVYLMASFVTSIDGKLAYLDDPAGPVIAKENKLDSDGADADFWILNLLRANCDAIFCGAGTIANEPDSTFHVFDEKLEIAREKKGLKPDPWLVVCSLVGTDIPFKDSIFEKQKCMYNISPNALEVVEKNIEQDYYVVGPYKNIDEIEEEKIREDFKNYADKKAPIIVTGESNRTDSKTLLKILKILGIDKALVESPSYCHVLLGEKLLDEMFVNYSCVYVGGDTVSFGKGMKSYTSKAHPHSELLSIHMHSPSFLYFRHKFNYEYM
ncbi:MAG: dihydrofolate reductase family protein [Fusobacteriaceae bacterium]